MKNDNKCMELIIHSGEAQAYAMEAIKEARMFNFEKSYELIEKAEEEQLEAHKVQTEFIVEMAKEREKGINVSPANVLLVHALDHVNTGLISIDFAKELIESYKLMKELGEHVNVWK